MGRVQNIWATVSSSAWDPTSFSAGPLRGHGDSTYFRGPYSGRAVL